MGKKISLLVDTDIFIDYFNHQLFKEFFDTGRYRIYYSVVTKKELLSKEGLTASEEKSIRFFLKKFRMIPLNPLILKMYSTLREKYPFLAKEDTLIAATGIAKKLPLVTRNYRHYRVFTDLLLYFKDGRID